MSSVIFFIKIDGMNLCIFAVVNVSFKDTSSVLRHGSPQGQNASEQREHCVTFND